MKVAIVHDWLTNLGGAERVVYELHKMYPDAPIFTSVYDPKALPMFKKADVRTTWLQKLPSKLKFKHQLWTPIRPKAFRSLDLSEFDVVISSSSAESKQVRVRDGAVHICYCHTPIRYFWVNYDQYKKDPGLGPLNFLAPIIMPLFVGPLKRSDYKASQKVDFFVANSTTVRDRIKKYYDRDSTVIHPPVDVNRFHSSKDKKRDGLLVVGRQIPYKKIDVAVEACSSMDRKLNVVGVGPEHQNLVDMAGDSISFYEDVDDKKIVDFFQGAEGFIFPPEEDFGIVPVEAMAAGTPVIAYGVGGATDSVINKKTGVFFAQQNAQSLKTAIEQFDNIDFDKQTIENQANKFSDKRFRDKFSDFVRAKRPS